MFSRRQALKSLATGTGSLALAPFLQHMRLHAEGASGSLPKRFMFVVKDSGLLPYGIQPEGVAETGVDSVKQSGVTKLTKQSLDEVKLNPTMQALEPHKDYVNIIQGLSSRASTGASGGHSLKYGALGVYSGGGRPSAETIDGALCKKLPGIFQHVGFEMWPGRLITYPRISAYDKNKTLPFFADPQFAYKNLFGAVSQDKAVKAQLAMEKNLLDFLSADIRKVQKRLTQEEKQKLDHYLEGFESLSDRRVKLANTKDIQDWAPRLDNKYTSDVETHQLEAHFDMAAAALLCGLTNVVTIRCDDTRHSTYRGLGHVNNLHAVAHMENSGRGSGSDSKEGNAAIPKTKEEAISMGIQLRDDIREFHAQLIAGVAAKLRAIPEGDGNMLDNTMIVYLSESADKHHPSGANLFPTYTVGNINGAFETGRYVRYPSRSESGHRTLANFYTSLLRAAGDTRPHFGQKDLTMDPALDQDGVLDQIYLG